METVMWYWGNPGAASGYYRQLYEQARFIKEYKQKEKKMSKKFVIMEVEEYKKVADPDFVRYVPKDAKRGVTWHEEMVLHPSRIIDSDRLRYGRAEKGDKYFGYNSAGLGWFNWVSAFPAEHLCLLLKPPPEEKGDLDKLIDEAPSCVGREAKEWAKKLIELVRKEGEK